MLILLVNPQREALFVLSVNYGEMLHCGDQVSDLYRSNHKLKSLEFLGYIFTSVLKIRIRSCSLPFFRYLSIFHIHCWLTHSNRFFLYWMQAWFKPGYLKLIKAVRCILSSSSTTGVSAKSLLPPSLLYTYGLLRDALKYASSNVKISKVLM